MVQSNAPEVEAGRQEHPDRHVGHHMVWHRIAHGIGKAAQHVGSAPGSAGALGQCLGNVVVRRGKVGTGYVDGDHRTCRKAVKPPPHREGFGYAAEQMATDDARRVGIARRSVTGRQGFGLRREPHSPAVVAPIERLDTHASRASRSMLSSNPKGRKRTGHAACTPSRRRNRHMAAAAPRCPNPFGRCRHAPSAHRAVRDNCRSRRSTSSSTARTRCP